MYKSPSDPCDFLRASSFSSEIAWEREPGTHLFVDPELKMRHRTIYRYVNSVPEADAVLAKKRWRFDHPTTWPDKYEAYIADHLFDNRKTAASPMGGAAPFDGMAIYAKCFSFHSAPEASWQLNKRKVRLTLTLGGLIRSLATAKRDDDLPPPDIYIGRVRYMDPWVIRDTLEALRKSDPKNVSRLAVPALLMKRVGFHFENEVRVLVACATSEPATEFVELAVEDHAIVELMINPYFREVVAQELLHKYGSRGVPVARSRFDLEPLSS